jgi:hypothetical protein
MIAELAMGDLSYRQIRRKYGKTENNVQHLLGTTGDRSGTGGSYEELRLRCNGEKQYRVKVLKEFIEEMNERLAEFAEVCNRLDLRFLEIRLLDPETRSAREESRSGCGPDIRPVARDAKNRYLRGGYRLTCNEKTSGIRTGGTTSRELPTELCTFELSGTVGCASNLRHCLSSS